MIKIQTAKPFVTYSSKKYGGFADFKNSVNDARLKVESKIRMSEMSDFNDSRRTGKSSDYVYLYEIIKVNVKKKNTKKKQTSPQGNKVVKREVVNEGSVTVKLFRFKRENVVSSKQHKRHFEVVLKV